MERSEKRDHVWTFRLVTGQLERCFDRFRAGIREEDSLRRRTGRYLGHFPRQVALWQVVEVRPRHMDQLRRLLLNCGDHPRVAVARRADGDSGGEVEKDVAVDILNNRSFAP